MLRFLGVGARYKWRWLSKYQGCNSESENAYGGGKFTKIFYEWKKYAVDMHMEPVELDE